MDDELPDGRGQERGDDALDDAGSNGGVVNEMSRNEHAYG
jgi:hypothetical protein